MAGIYLKVTFACWAENFLFQANLIRGPYRVGASQLNSLNSTNLYYSNCQTAVMYNKLIKSNIVVLFAI